VAEVFTWFNHTISRLNTNFNTLANYQEISAARGLTQQFNLPYYIDLGSFAYQLARFVQNITFQQFAGNLSQSVQTAISYHLALSGLPGATGLALNFNEYEVVPLTLLTDSAFEEFLTNFLSLGKTAATSIIALTLGPLTGYLDGKDDSVYYRFMPQISVEHTITLSAFQSTDEDFDLYLYDSYLNLLTRSVGLTSDEALQWVLIPGRLYYIRVYSSPGVDITNGLGSFEVQISPGSPIDPASVVLQIGVIITILCIISLVLYILWRNWERITRAIERYRVRRMARRLQSEATTETLTSTGTGGACVECDEELPKGARFCPNCREPFREPTEEKKS
jgi:hypothetical protein